MILRKLKKWIGNLPIFSVVRSAGFEWLLLLIPIGLFIFFGWMFLDGVR